MSISRVFLWHIHCTCIYCQKFFKMKPLYQNLYIWDIETHIKLITWYFFCKTIFKYISLPSFWHTATNFLLTATQTHIIRTTSKKHDYSNNFQCKQKISKHWTEKTAKYHRQLDVGVYVAKTFLPKTQADFISMEHKWFNE